MFNKLFKKKEIRNTENLLKQLKKIHITTSSIRFFD